jgi:hypothetical protein
MILSRRAAVLSALVFAIGVATAVAQNAPDATRPALTGPEMEAFLLNGKIVGRGRETKGVTAALRVTLTDGRLTHDAQVQDVDIYKPLFNATRKATEIDFRDSYRYNIAAYRLARLLGLDNVPMSVLRTVDGKPASVTWWVDDVVMDEAGREALKTNPLGPNPSRTGGYLQLVRVFDELIQNRDRNKDNLLWTRDWTMWMIDHTRAFRTDHKLLRPETLDTCERNLLAGLKRLTHATLTAAVGTSLIKPEIDALMERRDVIVKLFDDKIAKRGEAAALYTLPR